MHALPQVKSNQGRGRLPNHQQSLQMLGDSFWQSNIGQRIGGSQQFCSMMFYNNANGLHTNKPRAPPDILMAVMPKGYPLMKFSNNQAKLIEIYLLQKMDETLEDATFPQFSRLSYQKGLLVIACTGVWSRQWLEAAMAGCCPWVGADLRVLETRDIPKVLKITVPGCGYDVAKILHRLKRQNPGLETRNWRVMRHRQLDNSLEEELIFTVDHNSWVKVGEFNCELYLNFTRIKAVFWDFVKESY